MSVGGRREPVDATTDGPGDCDNMIGTVIDRAAPVDLIASALRTATPQSAVAEARTRPGQVPSYDTFFAPERL